MTTSSPCSSPVCRSSTHGDDDRRPASSQSQYPGDRQGPKRLGVLGGDTQGWPNGRRLDDDVIDIAEQAVGGFLKGTKPPLGDGVDRPTTRRSSALPVRRGSGERVREHEGHAEAVGARSGWGGSPTPTEPGRGRETNPETCREGGDIRHIKTARRRCAVVALSRRGPHRRRLRSRSGGRGTSERAISIALSELRRGPEAARSRGLENAVARYSHQADALGASGSPTRCAGARRATRRICLAPTRRSRGALAAARGSDRNARPREPGADPARVPRRPRVGREARRLAPYSARPYGVIGDALIELGRYRAAFATLRAHGRAEAEPRFVRPHRLRPRADAAIRRGDLGDAARARRRRRSARADGLGARRARRSSSLGRGRLVRPSAHVARALGRPRLRLRARAARAGRGRRGRARGGRRGRAPRRRSDAAAAVRRPARRPPRTAGPTRARQPSRRRSRRSSGCSPRTASASTSSRRSTAPTTGSGPPRRSRSRGVRAPTGPRSTVTTRSGGRSRAPAAATRRCPGSTARCGSGRGTRCSGSIAATRPAAPETGRR